MKKIYSILMAVLLCCTTAWAETLGPLYNGTNAAGSSIPVEGNTADYYQRVQVIYPKADLVEALAGKSITALTFYVTSKAANDWNTIFEISLAETSTNSFSSTAWLEPEGLTVVYTGKLSGKSDELVVTFDKPFTYSGKNNLFFELKTKEIVSGYGKATFAAKGGYDLQYSLHNANSSAMPSSGNRKYVLPKTMFTYEEAGSATCDMAANLIIKEKDANSATLAWDKAEGATWQYICLPAASELDWTSATQTTDTFAVLSDLTKETAYKFYVRRYCSAEDQSKEISIDFTTDPTCFAPTLLSIPEESITATSAVITWHASGHGETQWQYTFEVWDDETPDWSEAVITKETEVTLEGLNPQTAYQVWVRSYCSSEDQSAPISEYFVTACGVEPLTFTEDFSSDIDCWKMVDCTSGWTSTGVSSGAFRFVYNSNPPQYLITPELAISEKKVIVGFEYKEESSYNHETFAVGYSKTTNAVEEFTWLSEVTTEKTTYEKYEAELPAGTKFVAIKCLSNDKYYLWIDNFSVAEVSTPTAIDNTVVNGKSTKRIENGTLLIENNGVLYNAQGARVSK